MDVGHMHHGFFVGLFDILGFEHRLKNLGLSGMLARYEALIRKVEARNHRTEYYFGDNKFDEAPYWLNDGGIFIFNKVYGAYASDSILLWCNRTWPEARTMTVEQLKSRSSARTNGWVASPVPCDPFLEACNELMCLSLETGLPLRGAVSMGAGVFDRDRPLFLGLPLVEAARMEKEQSFIGASICKSFADQIIPKRFVLEFDDHLKQGADEHWGGSVLDWPRHWRHTRSRDLAEVFSALDTSPAHGHYYENTRRLVALSVQFADQFETMSEMDIRSQYPEFSAENQELTVHMMAVRKVPIDKPQETD